MVDSTKCYDLVGLFKLEFLAAVSRPKFGYVNAVSRIIYVSVLISCVLTAASIASITD
jgi:uncharacterized membrane protein YuzA (DUF378 family)